MALTDKFISGVKPLPQARKYFDMGGMYLYVPPSGAKVFRYAYRFHGKPKTYVIGKYPNVSLPCCTRKSIASIRKAITKPPAGY